MSSPNRDPIFISRPFHWDAELTSQSFPRSGGTPGSTPVLLGTSNENGGVISSVSIEVTGNTSTTGNVCMLFSQRDGQSTVRKRCEVTLPQVTTASNTSEIAGYPIHFQLPDYEPFEGAIVQLLKIEPKESLYVALIQSENTSSYIVHAVGGLYDQI